jgi:hypothetical protein
MSRPTGSFRGWWSRKRGPLGAKFWNFRHFSVKSLDAGVYRSSWNNGAFEPSQINWAIPNFAHQDILGRIRHWNRPPPRRPSDITRYWRELSGAAGGARPCNAPENACMPSRYP